MIETSAVKYNGRRPAGWRAAITKTDCRTIIVGIITYDITE